MKKPTLHTEEIPDGTYEVNVISDVGGYRIGSAIVTVSDGLSTATICISDDAAKSLGINLRFESEAMDPNHSPNRYVVVAKKES